MDVFFLATARQIWPSNRQSYVQGLQETARAIFNNNKRALYRALHSWQLAPEILSRISTTFHSRFSEFIQQLSGKHVKGGPATYVTSFNVKGPNNAQAPVGQHSHSPVVQHASAAQLTTTSANTSANTSEQNSNMQVRGYYPRANLT